MTTINKAKRKKLEKTFKKQDCKILSFGFPKKEQEALYKYFCFFFVQKLNLPIEEIRLFWDSWVLPKKREEVSLTKWNNTEFKIHLNGGEDNRFQCVEIYLNNNFLTPSSIGTMELVAEIFLSLSYVRTYFETYGHQSRYVECAPLDGKQKILFDKVFSKKRGVVFSHDAFIGSFACPFLLEASAELIEADLLPEDFDTSLLYYLLKDIEDMAKSLAPFMMRENALKHRRQAFYCALVLSSCVDALKRTFPTYLDGKRNDLEYLLENDICLLKEVNCILAFFEKTGFQSVEDYAKHLPVFNRFTFWFANIYHPYIYLRYSEKKSEKMEKTDENAKEDFYASDILTYRPTTWEDVEACRKKTEETAEAENTK